MRETTYIALVIFVTALGLMLITMGSLLLASILPDTILFNALVLILFAIFMTLLVVLVVMMTWWEPNMMIRKIRKISSRGR